MAKKLKFESFKYHFLLAAQKFAETQDPFDKTDWNNFLRELVFSNQEGYANITWIHPTQGTINIPLNNFRFYLRGDTDKTALQQFKSGLVNAEDPIKLKNRSHFEQSVRELAQAAGFLKISQEQPMDNDRIKTEREFHDEWARSENAEEIDVRASNEVCTAPEMRFIKQQLGDLKGKRLLDVGCGLGEASVYFALLGADVTSSDLSQGMLDATLNLAHMNAVTVRQHLASAENMQLAPEEKFDVIYAGNLLHHVDIDATIQRVIPHLADDGVFVSWDPLAYNPAINVYRSIATEVRTPDEHPLKWHDIKLFNKYFSSVEKRYFWLTTLIIFIIMALAQRRNPNKERFWKVIIKEGKKWAWLYRPLELLDRFLLSILPPLKLLCWNIVIIAKK